MYILHIYIYTPYHATYLQLQLTLPLRLRQLFHQQKPLLPRPTPILSSLEYIRTLGFRPFPQILQFGFQRALHRIDDFVAQHREEFVGVAAAAGGDEEVFGGWVVGHDEIAFGAICIC